MQVKFEVSSVDLVYKYTAADFRLPLRFFLFILGLENVTRLKIEWMVLKLQDVYSLKRGWTQVVNVRGRRDQLCLVMFHRE